MSNPAVMTLADASSKDGRFRRFVLEDNIGESIHLHMDAIRMDFSIEQFLQFAELVKDSLENMDILKGHSLKEFDAHFLNECAPFLKDLEKISFEKVKITDLKAVVRVKFKSLTLLKIKKVSDTPSYKYLKGESSKFEQYEQFNYLGTKNTSRLKNLKQSIEENGYPFNKKHIVLFEGQNIIRDGQHRASCLLDLYGTDQEVTVMRMHFKGSKHHLNSTKVNLVSSFNWFFSRSKQKAKRIVKRLLALEN